MQRITRFGSGVALYIRAHCPVGSVAPGAAYICTDEDIGKFWGTVSEAASLLRELRRSYRVRRDPNQYQTIHVYVA